MVVNFTWTLTLKAFWCNINDALVISKLSRQNLIFVSCFNRNFVLCSLWMKMGLLLLLHLFVCWNVSCRVRWRCHSFQMQLICIFLCAQLSEKTEILDDCSTNCNGNGECISGHCHCFPGFLGPDCAKGNLILTDPQCMTGIVIMVCGCWACKDSKWLKEIKFLFPARWQTVRTHRKFLYAMLWAKMHQPLLSPWLSKLIDSSMPLPICSVIIKYIF